MNIYLLEQNINNRYDTYDSCVVIAENEEDARNIHPSSYIDVLTRLHKALQDWENDIEQTNLLLGIPREQ